MSKHLDRGKEKLKIVSTHQEISLLNKSLNKKKDYNSIPFFYIKTSATYCSLFLNFWAAIPVTILQLQIAMQLICYKTHWEIR